MTRRLQIKPLDSCLSMFNSGPKKPQKLLATKGHKRNYFCCQGLFFVLFVPFCGRLVDKGAVPEFESEKLKNLEVIVLAT